MKNLPLDKKHTTYILNNVLSRTLSFIIGMILIINTLLKLLLNIKNIKLFYLFNDLYIKLDLWKQLANILQFLLLFLTVLVNLETIMMDLVL